MVLDDDSWLAGAVAPCVNYRPQPQGIIVHYSVITDTATMWLTAQRRPSRDVRDSSWRTTDCARSLIACWN